MAHSTLHISCQEVVELVTDYLERAMPIEDAAVFEQHLNFCDGCVLYVDQVRKTIAAAGQLSSAEDVPDEMKARLMIAFRDWKRA